MRFYICMKVGILWTMWHMRIMAKLKNLKKWGQAECMENWTLARS